MRRAVAVLLAFSLWGPAGAAPPPTENGDMDALIDRGLRDMYNLDYASARAAFTTLVRKFPGHPIGLYGLATTLWWELTNDYDENNPALEKEFLAAADRSIAHSRALLKTGDPSGAARLCLGGALGLKARWNAIQGHWLAAYRGGKQAFDIQEQALRVNPELYDAYLGVGIFHYYVAVLPAVIKVFARMVFGGSREQGLKEINLAREKGRFSRTAALLFLVNLYVNNEKNPAKSLEILREGRREYPDSPFFHFAELLILDEAGDGAGLRAGALDYLDRIRRGAPFYDKKREHLGLYALANSYMLEGDTARALDQYDALIADHPGDDRWMTLAHLRRGMARDVIGRRDLALEDYRTVLKRRDVWGLHDKAKALLRTPYSRPA